MVRHADEPAGCLARAGGILQRLGGRGGLGGGHRGLRGGHPRGGPASAGRPGGVAGGENRGGEPGGRGAAPRPPPGAGGGARAATAAGAHWRPQLTALSARFDLLAAPTLAILPPKLASADELLVARHTLPANLAGVPALALPIPARGPLPASLQLVSAWGSEERLLAAGAAVEAPIAPA